MRRRERIVRANRNRTASEVEAISVATDRHQGYGEVTDPVDRDHAVRVWRERWAK